MIPDQRIVLKEDVRDILSSFLSILGTRCHRSFEMPGFYYRRSYKYPHTWREGLCVLISSTCKDPLLVSGML